MHVALRKMPPLDGHGPHCDRRIVSLPADGQYGIARAPDVHRRGLDDHAATRQIKADPKPAAAAREATRRRL